MSELGLKSLPKTQINYPIKSLIKALCILEALGENGTLGVTDLGRRLGMRLSTVHRLLGTLKGKGYVVNHLKPILISAGADLSTKLGASPLPSGPSQKFSGRSPRQRSSPLPTN